MAEESDVERFKQVNISLCIENNYLVGEGRIVIPVLIGEHGVNVLIITDST